MPIALDALEQSKHRGPQRNRTAVLTFLESSRRETLREQYELPLETSKALLRFHEIVDYFISDFTTKRLVIIKKYVNPENLHASRHDTLSAAAETETDSALSQIEYSRLARAIYHLELYGSLFNTSGSRRDDITVIEQSSLFLQRLRDWELEEFLCVRNYFLEKLTDYLDQVEDDFMQDFLEDEPHTIEPRGSSSRWDN